MSLYGRSSLLADLNRRAERVSSTGRGQILAVQGRRQVGKSTLLTTFTDAGTTAYLYATAIKSGPVHRQLAAYTEAALQSRRPLPNAALLFSSPPSSWSDAFARLAIAARQGPVVVVLDEFPWAVEQSPTLEGELQVAWDTELEKLPVLLILVGSDVAMMDRLSDHDRPLYGRTTPLVIPALNPAEVAQALPTATPMDVFDAYLMTGGYPRLLRTCADAGGPAQYARAALQSDTADLVVTARLSLAAEFPDAGAAYRVLSAIGSSPTAHPGFMDVVSAIADPDARETAKTAITRALTTLTRDKRLIEIMVPAGAPATSKLRRYRVTDPYLSFWFFFVQRHLDNIGRGRADLALAQYERSWPSWRGVAIEAVVRESVLRLGANDARFRSIEQVGAWWNRDHSVEVDLVATGRSGPLMLGTIKWRNSTPITRREVAELHEAGSSIPGAQRTDLVGICPAGSDAGAGLALTLDAADLLRAWS